MESDSKDILKKSDSDRGQDKKEDLNLDSNKKSCRRKFKDSTRERKKNELPAVLMPKFPSQKLVKKKKSNDKIDQKLTDREENERTPMCPTDKLLEEQEELNEKKNEDREDQEEEQMDLTQEPPPPPDQPIVEDEPKKSIPEKPPPVSEQPFRSEKPTTKSRMNDGKSGRSEDRKTKKVVTTLENKKLESRRRTLPSKKPSAENLFSDEDGKKSYKKSKRVPTKKTGNLQKPSANEIPPSANVVASPDGPEKSTDEKARKPITPTVTPPVAATPTQTGPPTLKKDQSSSGQKPKPASSTPSSRRIDVQRKRKRKGFLKNVYNITKFWGRKSDCVANPTTEMLAKSYVPPEYDKKNTADFKPNPSGFFGKFRKEELQNRVRTNPAANDNNDIFFNNRPFWLTRQPEDDPIPKVRIQLHRPLLQLYHKGSADIPPPMRRQMPFQDPKVGNWKVLKAVDKTIGIEETDSTRDKERDRAAKDKAKEGELKRVMANTFYATLFLEDKKKPQDVEPAPKSMEEQVSGKKVTWQFPSEPTLEKLKKLLNKPDVVKIPENIYEYPLQTYNRKDRPNPENCCKRAFGTFGYVVGVSKIPRKTVVAPTTSSSGTSLSSKSISKSSSAEKK